MEIEAAASACLEPNPTSQPGSGPNSIRPQRDLPVRDATHGDMYGRSSEAGCNAGTCAGACACVVPVTVPAGHFPPAPSMALLAAGGLPRTEGSPLSFWGPVCKGTSGRAGKKKKIKQPRRIFPATSRLDQTRLRAPSGLRSDVTPDEAEFKIVSIAPWWPCPSRLYKCPVLRGLSAGRWRHDGVMEP